MAPEFVHATAIVESDTVGSGTRVWAYAHILPGVQIGTHCNIGDHAFVESGARIGNNVTIKNHVCIWEGVTIEDDCFLGPHAVFTNDQFPRSPRMSEAAARYEKKQDWLKHTIVERGCSIGANATILPGIRLGAYAMIAAGATVTHDVPPHALMMGTPARQVGVVCRCGRKIENNTNTDMTSDMTCAECGTLINDFIADRQIAGQRFDHTT
jgi:UDP-2-acetamido-3-amino-2,3-dideoxy-glucuronate N-acetyltransferase